MPFPGVLLSSHRDFDRTRLAVNGPPAPKDRVGRSPSGDRQAYAPDLSSPQLEDNHNTRGLTMGDRALVIFTDGKEVSPVIYLHWHGSRVPELLAQLKLLMASRGADASYAAARFTHE
jgi:hypothetical protein